jgi:hypothetical protein
VDRRPGPGDQRAVREDGRDDGDVVLVDRARVGIVAEENVALVDARVVGAYLLNDSG